DPHVHEFNGRVYMYATHDERNAAPLCCSGHWWVWSTEDLVSWKQESMLQDFAWTPKDLLKQNFHWATDAAERDGRYYWYVSMGGSNVAVASGASPVGPWEDPLGHMLLSKDFGHSLEPPTEIRDPGVLQDEDGRYYIVFGACAGPVQPDDSCYYLAELWPNMTSVKQPQHLSVQGAFGPYGAGKTDDKPFLHKHAGIYYLSWGVFYGTSTTPFGPYTYRGSILEPSLIEPAFRIGNESQEPWYTRQDYADRHGSFLELHGQAYFFCNDYSHSDALGFRGTVAAYVHYRADGSIEPIVINAQGVGSHDASLEAVLPAENYFAIAGGARKQQARSGGFEIVSLASGSTLIYSHVRNIGGGRIPWLRVANGGDCTGFVELRLGRLHASGPSLGRCTVPPTGGWEASTDVPCELTLPLAEDDADFVLAFGGCEEEFARLDHISFAAATLWT
ncbi:unnamed protein product, partial [Polarella glacialis]